MPRRSGRNSLHKIESTRYAAEIESPGSANQTNSAIFRRHSARQRAKFGGSAATAKTRKKSMPFFFGIRLAPSRRVPPRPNPSQVPIRFDLRCCSPSVLFAASAGVRKCSMSSAAKTERPGQAARAETTFMQALIRLARATIFLETSVHLTPFASGAPTATAYAAAAAAGAARACLCASRTRKRGATGALLSYPISFRVQGSGRR